MTPAPLPGAGATLPRPNHPERSTAPAARARFPWAGLLLASAPLIGICLVGFPYYALPMAERVRHPFHAWLRSSGYVGQSAGLLALVLMGFLWLYPVRKRYRRLAFTGPVSGWLEAHVFAALTLPLVAAIHAAWRFGGIIGLGFWAMVIVWLSGVVGRYLYTRIPRGRAGLELTREEIAAERRRLLETLAAQTGLEPALLDRTLAVRPVPADVGAIAALRRLVADDLDRRRAARSLRALLQRRGAAASPRAVRDAVRLARREMALAQQARVLDATQRLLRLWHVAHRPVAIGALVAVLVHVAVVIAVGATWLW
ncbi:MAG TPA: hypothetical protein VFT84_02850 [Gemmatimonadales bacterium]|nr:hypothetical protein [Gemmatimonadales bacterium]